MVRSITLLFALCVLLLAGVPAAPASDASPVTVADGAKAGEKGSDLVWCLDEERSLVNRTARWRCEGRVVSDDEAQRVKQARIDRIRRVLEREPILPGKRLSGTGTGFFISGDGHVLTNNHVIDNCKAVTVSPAGGQEIVASVEGRDSRRDLALLTTGLSTPAAALFRGFDEQIANEPVTIVGYPLHGKVVIKPVLVSGQVDLASQPGNPNIFAMKVDIRRGNSGGPVLDDAGRVIGVVFAKVDTPSVYEKTGKLIKDVGLAIRLPVVRDFLRDHPVAVTLTRENVRLEQHDRFIRAREFIAQIGCWR